MTLGTDLIEAVKRGGLSNWTTTTKQPSNQYTKKRKRDETQVKMDKIYSHIKGWMTTAEISRDCGYGYDMTYKYLCRLMDAGLVVRSQRGQPYTYRRK
ncbi:Z-DNA-binding protein [Caudoviricetes sp.]|nr:Z-DNA-binding protein [Caudoviricetes sp.]